MLTATQHIGRAPWLRNWEALSQQNDVSLPHCHIPHWLVTGWAVIQCIQLVELAKVYLLVCRSRVAGVGLERCCPQQGLLSQSQFENAAVTTLSLDDTTHHTSTSIQLPQ